MTYEETVELESNVKIKNDADRLCRDFHNNVKLDCKSYRGNGEFVIWSDAHNLIYVSCGKKYFGFHCRFLHETYDITVSPSAIFAAIKEDKRVIAHLRGKSRA